MHWLKQSSRTPLAFLRKAINEHSHQLPFSVISSVHFQRSHSRGAANMGTMCSQPRPQRGQTRSVPSASPRNTGSSQDLAPVPQGGRDKAPLTITTQTTGCSLHTVVTTGNAQLSIHLPHLSSSFPYLFCPFPPIDISQKGQYSFFMGMTEKPVVTSQTRVNKPQAKIKSNR